MNYKNKYLKYKMKYLNMIKKTGGSLSRDDRAKKRTVTKQIQEQENEIEELQNEIQELQNEIDLKDNEISMFHDLCKDKEEQNNKLKRDLDNCNINVNYLNNLQQIAARHIYVLRNEIDRLNNLIRITQNNSQIA
tara:strand:- start:657 stop:1061 length:405 start_codon:yes stop_codon:yes gene_type:complete